MMDHSRPSFLPSQASAYAGVHAGSGDTVLTGPHPGRTSSESQRHPAPWLLSLRDAADLRNSQSLHLAGKDTGMAQHATVWAKKNLSIHFMATPAL
jgi:hypothetical protein